MDLASAAEAAKSALQASRSAGPVRRTNSGAVRLPGRAEAREVSSELDEARLRRPREGNAVSYPHPELELGADLNVVGAGVREGLPEVQPRAWPRAIGNPDDEMRALCRQAVAQLADEREGRELARTLARHGQPRCICALKPPAAKVDRMRIGEQHAGEPVAEIGAERVVRRMAWIVEDHSGEEAARPARDKRAPVVVCVIDLVDEPRHRVGGLRKRPDVERRRDSAFCVSLTRLSLIRDVPRSASQAWRRF